MSDEAKEEITLKITTGKWQCLIKAVKGKAIKWSTI